jgi:hypothetical protein
MCREAQLSARLFSKLDRIWAFWMKENHIGASF